MTNNYITETFLEYPDNYSIAVIVYFCGCDRDCVGCHNTDLQSYKELPKTTIQDIIEYATRLNTNKIVLCGGDPLYYKNLPLTKEILKTLGKNYDICIYTGAELEDVKSLNLSGFKFIKCGFFDPKQFVGSTKTDEFMRFATKNQTLYDKDFNLLSENGVYYYDNGRCNKETN